MTKAPTMLFTGVAVAVVLIIFGPQASAQTPCEAHKELKRWLYEEKMFGAGSPNGAAMAICASQGRPLDSDCIEFEEDIIRQQMRQVDEAIRRDC